MKYNRAKQDDYILQKIMLDVKRTSTHIFMFPFTIKQNGKKERKKDILDALFVHF